MNRRSLLSFVPLALLGALLRRPALPSFPRPVPPPPPPKPRFKKGKWYRVEFGISADGEPSMKCFTDGAEVPVDGLPIDDAWDVKYEVPVTQDERSLEPLVGQPVMITSYVRTADEDMRVCF